MTAHHGTSVLDLPSELQIKIFEYLFQGNRVYLDTTKGACGHSPHEHRKTNKTTLNLNLLCISKDVRCSALAALSSIGIRLVLRDHFSQRSSALQLKSCIDSIPQTFKNLVTYLHHDLKRDKFFDHILLFPNLKYFDIHTYDVYGVAAFLTRGNPQYWHRAVVEVSQSRYDAEYVSWHRSWILNHSSHISDDRLGVENQYNPYTDTNRAFRIFNRFLIGAMHEGFRQYHRSSGHIHTIAYDFDTYTIVPRECYTNWPEIYEEADMDGTEDFEGAFDGAWDRAFGAEVDVDAVHTFYRDHASVLREADDTLEQERREMPSLDPSEGSH